MYKFTRLFIVFLGWAFPFLLQAQNSVLSSGLWLKIGITQSGIYKIDKSTLQKYGFDVNTLNPQLLKIYGNTGKMLPQSNAVSRAIDLQENAIQVVGEQDQKFDNDDYILFYGQSPHSLLFNTAQKEITHQTNIYSDTTFYFITLAQTPGLRIDTRTSTTTNNQIGSFDDYEFHEIDRRNILAQAPFAGSGREWYGEEFVGNSQQIFTFSGQNLMPNTAIQLRSSVLNTSYGQTEFRLSINGQALGTQSLDAITAERYDFKGKPNTQVFSINSNNITTSNTLSIALIFDRKALTSGGAFLNFLGLQSLKRLQLYNNQTHFRAFESLQYPQATFVLSEANNNLMIWDVTNPILPINQQYQVSNQQAQFGTNTSVLREFIAFNATGYLLPSSFKPLKNQNIRSIDTPDLLIVTAESIREYANQLANFRKEHDKLDVKVVSIEEIYNEFASGQPDISAIRDFAKVLFDRNPQKFKYLLLFGDASYDYKKRSVVVNNETKNIYIPAYQSRESLHPIYSYSSDDYFGFLEDTEGTWQEDELGDHTLEIGIGRLPVKSKTEAQDIVKKLISYAKQSSLGNWRSKVAFVADDGDGNIHQSDADYFSRIVNSTYPAYKSEKIYLDNYPLVSLPEGQRSPQANLAIKNTIEKGALIINYNGHGAESGWSDEQILTTKDIANWNNYKNMPLMLTATCQFGRYDDPNQVSGAELALLSNKGGAIALLTTTRPVFQSTNYLINQAFYENAFKNIHGTIPRLGDIVRITKNNSLTGVVNRNFALLGDPSMQLLYPLKDITIQTINSKKLTNADTLKALSRVTITGQIQDKGSDTVDKTFNGQVQIGIFDKPQTLNTLGGKGSKFTYNDYTNLIFQGKASIKNGQFDITFIVPKDINYQYGLGRIYLYAENPTTQTDATGEQVVVVGGSSKISTIDNTGPDVKLYLDEKVEKTLYITNANPKLIVELSDESGINIATDGLGHQIMLTLDDTTNVILNSYYTSELDNFKKGEILYNFENLREGNHLLKIKVWDVYNNSTEKTLPFRVVFASTNHLSNVKAFPNPFVDKTYFSFEHNRKGDDLAVSIEIFDSQGKLLKVISENVYDAPSPCENFFWDLTEDSLSIARGIYFYRIFVKSLTITYQASANGKLVSVK